uniref:N-acetylaspartate synthetase n=1 Tax=Hucho hucho TaxID=62062 RepID=A0A4W5LVS6_9TELE
MNHCISVKKIVSRLPKLARKYRQKGNNGFRTDRVVVRKFESVDYPDVERIFYDGLMEMVPDTSFLLTCLVPLAVLCARYYYSRRVVLGYMERAKPTDLCDIEGHYMTTPDSCLWEAVLEGSVVGVVAACGLRGEAGTVELNRMSVDRRCQHCGVGIALGQKVLQFSVDRGYLSVILGTRANWPGCTAAIPDSGVPMRPLMEYNTEQSWRTEQ